MIKVSPNEIGIIFRYISEVSGIHLGRSKTYLLETRLGGLLEEQGCSSYFELVQKAKADPGSSLEQKIIDRITTNETQFFRDARPFELLQHKILPDLIDARTGKSSGLQPISIRIWSAACSTGQEVYSIAIVLKELLFNFTKYNIRLLGTDISNSAISKASYGEYNKIEIERGLPRDKLEKHFTFNGDSWKVKDNIRTLASFKKLNLMKPLAGIGKFDIVFCRNVAIYFSPEDRKKLFDRIAGILEQDGYLIIGSTESLTGIHPWFEPKRYLKSIFYKLKVN